MTKALKSLIRKKPAVLYSYFFAVAQIFTASGTALANTFDVYCVPSLEGVSTCSGWKKDQQLQCISSPGGVATCHSSDKEKFSCTQDVSGLTTCGNAYVAPDKSQQSCTALGDGSFSCQNNIPPDTRQQNSSNKINAITDIIGENSESIINNSLPEEPESINQFDLINTPTLGP